MPTKTIVYAGLVAAAYAVLTLAFAPISYGPVQFRIGSLIKPLALFLPGAPLGLAVGVMLGNLASPFGPYDWAIMPIVTYGAASVAYRMRRIPVLSNVVHGILIAAGVAIFPLHMAAGIPIWPAIAYIALSEIVLYNIGYYVIWRRFPARAWENVNSDGSKQ